MKKFDLTHVTLYAKGHYDKTDDVWSDMKRCLTLDGYSGSLMNKNDIVSIIVNHIYEYGIHLTLLEFLSGIHKENTFKFGYITKDSKFGQNNDKYPLYEYETAIVKFCLSKLRFIDNNEWNYIEPLKEEFDLIEL